MSSPCSGPKVSYWSFDTASLVACDSPLLDLLDAPAQIRLHGVSWRDLFSERAIALHPDTTAAVRDSGKKMEEVRVTLLSAEQCQVIDVDITLVSFVGRLKVSRSARR